MTPDEEYAHYTAPEGQSPQGVPVRRTRRASEPPLPPPNPLLASSIDDLTPRFVDDDALAREARKPCAACGHAQFLHCDDHDDPCGCIPNPRTPVEDRCQCKLFVDPEVAP